MLVKTKAAFADVFDSSVLIGAAGYANKKKSRQLFADKLSVFNTDGNRKQVDQLLSAVFTGIGPSCRQGA
jgi:hypothetical protein